MKKMIVVAVVLFCAAQGEAYCYKSYVCNDYGRNCRYQDVCDNKYDIPSHNIPPIPAIPTLEIKPLPSLSIPPIGTSKCEYKMVNGRWMNLCW
jgi:hypothetical protein